MIGSLRVAFLAAKQTTSFRHTWNVSLTEDSQDALHLARILQVLPVSASAYQISLFSQARTSSQVTTEKRTASVSGFTENSPTKQHGWQTMRVSRFFFVVFLQLLFLFVDLFINSFGLLFHTADVVLLVLFMWVCLAQCKQIFWHVFHELFRTLVPCEQSLFRSS